MIGRDLARQLCRPSLYTSVSPCPRFIPSLPRLGTYSTPRNGVPKPKRPHNYGDFNINPNQ
jgi:hypothetical protein